MYLKEVVHLLLALPACPTGVLNEVDLHICPTLIVNEVYFLISSAFVFHEEPMPLIADGTALIILFKNKEISTAFVVNHEYFHICAAFVVDTENLLCVRCFSKQHSQ